MNLEGKIEDVILPKSMSYKIPIILSSVANFGEKIHKKISKEKIIEDCTTVNSLDIEKKPK